MASTTKPAWRETVTPVAVEPLSTEADVFARRDLLGLQGLSAGEIRSILKLAREMDFEEGAQRHARRLAGRTVATMFFEDSTRTRSSFIIAARKLGADVLELSGANSSVNKGETLVDSARAIEAMGVDAMVIRARQCGAAAMIAANVGVSVVNGGDGKHEHPTQGLLDMYTIAQAHNRLDSFDFTGMTVVIVGDLVSSRVARSGIAGLTTLGARVICVGPVTMAPKSLTSLGCEVCHDLDSVLAAADAVMMLRIQFERHGAEGAEQKAQPELKRTTAISSVREFREFYGLTRERAQRMKDGAVVLHPGPINRGIELDSAVAEGPRSVITRQVHQGVCVRMAALAMCLAGRS